jgi:hypothetical protein
MKNSNHTIGNRSRDLPTCSAVPQPTALPRATIKKTNAKFLIGILCVVNLACPSIQNKLLAFTAETTMCFALTHMITGGVNVVNCL